MFPSLGEIFRGRFADGFRRRAQLRKAGRLGSRREEPRRSTMHFEPLEQRLLLSADLNPVVDPMQRTILSHLLSFSPTDRVMTLATDSDVDERQSDAATVSGAIPADDEWYHEDERGWFVELRREIFNGEKFPDRSVQGVMRANPALKPVYVAQVGLVTTARSNQGERIIRDKPAGHHIEALARSGHSRS